MNREMDQEFQICGLFLITQSQATNTAHVTKGFIFYASISIRDGRRNVKLDEVQHDELNKIWVSKIKKLEVKVNKVQQLFKAFKDFTIFVQNECH